MKKYLPDYTFLLTIAGSIILVDQITKHLVRSNLSYGEIWPPDHWIVNYARIIHWQNTGAAFGMFQNLNTFFIILAILVSAAILYYFPRVPRNDWTLRIALSLELGGAVGNLIDRLHQGHVTDFISLDSFAVFNVADASISLGVAIMAISMWQREKKQSASSKTPPDKDISTVQEAVTNPLTEEVKGE